MKHGLAHVALLLCLLGCDQQATPAPSAPASGPTSSAQSGESAAPAGTGGPAASPAAGIPTTSQDLIAADLAAGTIDLGTSLEYRAWALFGDPRLPERYDGTGSTGEDLALMDEVVANLATLPADIQAELAPYLRRPTDPGSPFSRPAPKTAGVELAAARLAGDEVSDPCVEPRKWFSKDWSPDGSADTGFRVWACGVSMATVQGDLDSVIGIGAREWAQMTASEPGGMGRPVPDADIDEVDNGGDGKVDVYLVEPIAPCRLRGAVCQAIGNAVAVAQKDYPLNCGANGFPARGCSAYMVLARGRLEGGEFAADFVHEFFHVLQFAHNGKTSNSWYVEASAVWAEFHYEQAGAKRAAYAHYTAFQAANRSLLFYDPQSQYAYQAWGWPLFQEKQGSASSVFQAWQGAEGADTAGEIDTAIDGQLKFDENFREFAAWNAQPGAYIPPKSTGLEDSRWQSKGGIPDFPMDPHVETAQPRELDTGDNLRPARVDPLSAQYDEFIVSKDSTRQIEIDLRGLQNIGNADLDVLVQLRKQKDDVGDRWKRVEGDRGRVRLCRDLRDDDVFTVLLVVISNHASARSGGLPDYSQEVQGNYKVKVKDHCDVPIKYTGEVGGHNSFGDTWTGKATFELIPASDPMACEKSADRISYCYRFVSGSGHWECPGHAGWSGIIDPKTNPGDITLWIRHPDPAWEDHAEGVIGFENEPPNDCVTIGPVSFMSIAGADGGLAPISSGFSLSGTHTISGDYGSQTWTWKLTPEFDEDAT